MDSKVSSVLLKILFLENVALGLPPKGPSEILSSNHIALTHSFPGIAGQRKLATSRKSLPPNKRGGQDSPSLQAGRSQSKEGERRMWRERGHVYYCGEFSLSYESE